MFLKPEISCCRELISLIDWLVSLFIFIWLPFSMLFWGRISSGEGWLFIFLISFPVMLLLRFVYTLSLFNLRSACKSQKSAPALPCPDSALLTPITMQLPNKKIFLGPYFSWILCSLTLLTTLLLKHLLHLVSQPVLMLLPTCPLSLAVCICCPASRPEHDVYYSLPPPPASSPMSLLGWLSSYFSCSWQFTSPGTLT